MKRIKDVFSKFTSVKSVYSGGSYLTSGYNGVSDVDLSIVLDYINSKEIYQIENELKVLAKEKYTKISTCYSVFSEMWDDINIFGMHAHGKKRTSFLWDLKYSDLIYGEDLTEYFEDTVYHPFELYSDFSSVQNILLDAIGRNDLKKAINMSLVSAKIALILHGYFCLDKYEIIRTFTEKIDEDKGRRLYDMYNAVKQDLQYIYDYQFLLDFCVYCQQISRKHVNPHVTLKLG